MTEKDGVSKNAAAPGREAALKRLKNFYKKNLAESSNSLGETVVHETDRGAVILLSTALEDTLGQRLKRDMVALNSEETAKLFGPDAPVGTFSAKIRLAHALGFIDRDTSRICDLVREMRNACAHSGRDISFADDELSDIMRIAYKSVSGKKLHSASYKSNSLLGKMDFAWLVGYLTNVIIIGSKEDAVRAVNQASINAMVRAVEANQ